MLDEVVIGIAGKARGLRRNVSTAGSVSNRKSGFAALRCGRSKAIRLWPRTKDASLARSSSFANAANKLPPVNTKRRPVSAPHSGKGVNPAVPLADLEVEREAVKVK